MRKLLTIMLIASSSLAMAQVQRGDFNFTFNLAITSIDANVTGLVSAKAGFYVSKNLELGLTPQVFISDAVTTGGLGLYATANVFASYKVIPYVGVAGSVLGSDISDAISLGIGAYGGAKFFIKENVNIDIGLNGSALLVENTLDGTFESSGALIVFQVGVGILLGRRD